MLALSIMFLAGCFVAFSNYCMKRGVDAGGSSKGFLTVQLFVVFVTAILLNPVRSHDYGWSSSMAIFGLVGGVSLGLMMLFLGRSLELGPPGLTFATLSSSTVMPAIITAVLFGSAFGHNYTVSHAIGSLFVIGGLFWAGWGAKASGKKREWALFLGGAFVLHIVFLVFLSWRALFLKFPGGEGLILAFDAVDAKSEWFMPMVFISTFMIQFFVFAFTEKRLPNQLEVIFGIMGGIANGIGTFFMILATERATRFEQAMLYPAFSISVIILCNIWGQLLYKEKVNWKANLLCVLGIGIGSLT